MGTIGELREKVVKGLEKDMALLDIPPRSGDKGGDSMGDLISRKALLAECAERQKSNPLEDGRGWADHFLNDAQCPSAEWNSVEEMIEYAPAVDAAPVVHARWRKRASWDYYVCTECSFEANCATKYCPNCGAKMDLGEQEGER